MKPIFTLLLPLMLLTLSAFAPAKDLDGVIAALNTGNAAGVARYVDDKVEIGLPDKKGTYNSIFIPDFCNNIPAIGNAFQELTADPQIDPNGICVEVYENDTDVRCMVRLRD